MAGRASATAVSAEVEAELRTFVATDYARVVAATAMATGDRSAAEDAVQDAMVLAWQRRDEITNLSGWITVVASRRLIDRARSGAAERRAADRLGALSGDVVAGEQDAAGDRLDLAVAIGELSERQRQAVVLHYYLGLSVDECAGALGVSAGTVKTTLHRARQRLGELIGPAADDGPVEEGGGDA